MKEKPNYAELEKQIDFTALAGKLGQLTEQDNPQRKTVFSLLDKVRDQILAARRNRNVSYHVLAKELAVNGSVLDIDISRMWGSLRTMARKLRAEYPGAVYGKVSVPAIGKLSREGGLGRR